MAEVFQMVESFPDPIQNVTDLLSALMTFQDEDADDQILYHFGSVAELSTVPEETEENEEQESIRSSQVRNKRLEVHYLP